MYSEMLVSPAITFFKGAPCILKCLCLPPSLFSKTLLRTERLWMTFFILFLLFFQSFSSSVTSDISILITTNISL
ncbi:hypothetical protein E2C01_060403 [Portunus trituberculatus]|uniref:Uncharacterized protein n=1 Tax=Portunus trituberculatus TaxID=210409 RepID=A0A5B7H8M3_PORTR|nr:hypothetical protein [Portunus trituberculatus]